MPDEVRYQFLRPAQIVARRKACPVGWLPIGTLEWHGVHNPLGTDTIQAEALAIRCAQKLGGLALPPLYYGESRVESLVDANSSDRDLIAREMGLDPSNHLTSKFPAPPAEQVLNYHKLLLHLLAEMQSLGFKIGVLVAGHYPLLDHARAAVLVYNRSELSKRGGMLAWTCLDVDLLREQYPGTFGHAGRWETSHLLHLCPECVDMKLLPPKGQPVIGVGGEDPPQDATVEYGRETLAAAVEVAVEEVRHRLAHPEMYRTSGTSLLEGLWKKKA
jgi:creatinine amidohydrolase